MNGALLFVSLVLSSHLFGQTTVTRIAIHAEPADARIRPFENAVAQVRVYGKSGNLEGRILRDGVKVRVVDSNGGWVSKPFKFQGKDDEAFIQQYQSTAGRIFQDLTGQYVMQDTVLYTAPDRPGEYKLEATLEGQSASASIRVEANATSSRKPERTSFPADPAVADPYRDLAEHYAPFLAQETWFQPKADYPTRFNYDGDWNGANNWESLDIGTSQAYVHYAAVETASHWFLIYNVFHPRDYSDKCVAGTCHENDNEGLILTVAKDGGKYGRLQVMETLAHNNVYLFRGRRPHPQGRARHRREHRTLSGLLPVHLHRIRRPWHLRSRSSHSRYEVGPDRFSGGTGVTCVYKKAADRPKHPNDRLVAYDLLDIYSNWWLKCNRDGDWRESTFDNFFSYQPLGGRPGSPFRSIAGSFLGRAMGQNLAKPFWGWHDNRTIKQKILAVGQWGLDPAYGVSRNLTFPPGQPVSLDYVFNPYLAISPAQPVSPVPGFTSPAPPVPLQPSTQAAGPRGWFEVRV